MITINGNTFWTRLKGDIAIATLRFVHIISNIRYVIVC
jgi:hypothetical protein